MDARPPNPLVHKRLTYAARLQARLAGVVMWPTATGSEPWEERIRGRFELSPSEGDIRSRSIVPLTGSKGQDGRCDIVSLMGRWSGLS